MYMNDVKLKKDGTPDKRQGQNLPTMKKKNAANRLSEEEKSVLSERLRALINDSQLPRVTTDEELEERLMSHLLECADNARIPTIESLYLSTGIPTRTLNAYLTGESQGLGPHTQEILERARDIVKTMDAELVLTGRIRDVPYIFRSKNLYGMKDQTDINYNTRVTMQLPDSKQLQKKYLEDVKIESDFND